MNIKFWIYIPVAIIWVFYITFFILDIKNSNVKYIPKWAWLGITLFSIPLGGIIYFFIGRNEDSQDDHELY